MAAVQEETGRIREAATHSSRTIMAFNSPDLNPVDNSTWEMLQEKVYKTRITALELSTTPLMNGFCNNDIVQL